MNRHEQYVVNRHAKSRYLYVESNVIMALDSQTSNVIIEENIFNCMKSENGAYSLIKTISLIAGSIALIGIIVGLYFQILPERNIVIRYAEMGFFSLCLPVLIGEAWQSLKTIKCTLLLLKSFLCIMSTGLLGLLYLANQNGGILTYEFLTVVALTIAIILLIAVGAEPIKRMLFNGRPIASMK